MKNRISFSNNIIKTIRLVFGLAFFVMFVGGGILLYVAETDINIFYIKIISTLIAYIILYFVVMIALTRNIRKQFAPLDKLAKGLKDNSIDIIGDNDDIKKFAFQLKIDMEKLDNLDMELKETKLNLDDAYVATEKTINDTLNGIEECKKILAKCNKRERKSKDKLDHIAAFLVDIDSELINLKQKQKFLAENSENVKTNISLNINSQDEIRQDYTKVCDTYNILAKTLNEAVALIDSLFSEISVLQNISSQINLYAMNTSIEASRSGIFNINITNALDELKSLSAKIQTKSDDVALLSIRSKNALNLAIEQSEFCNEENEGNMDLLSSSVDKLNKLSDIISETVIFADDLIESTKTINLKIQDIKELDNNLLSDCDYMLYGIDDLGNQLFEIDKELKNNEI